MKQDARILAERMQQTMAQAVPEQDKVREREMLKLVVRECRELQSLLSVYLLEEHGVKRVR